MKILIPLLTLLFMTALLSAVHLYLAHKVNRFFDFFTVKISYRLLVFVSVGLSALLVIGFARSLLPLPEAIKEMLKTVNAYQMACLICLLLVFVLTDVVLLLGRLVRLIPHPMPNAVRFFAFSTAILLSIATALYGFLHATQIKTVSYEIDLIKSESSPMNLVLVSDLHLGAVGSESRLEKIVEEINALNPDLVCIAGDIFDNDFNAIKDPARVITLLQSISSVHGVYACLGNHDSGETFAQMEELLAQGNVTLLKDSYTVIDDRLVLMGRLDASPIGGYDEQTARRELSEVMDKIHTHALPIVVMDHNPAHIDEYGTSVDLILSGHTHKGQIFPANFITDLMYTVDYGYYQKDEQSPHVIVTSGAGAWGMPLRIGTDCEVVSIQLH